MIECPHTIQDSCNAPECPLCQREEIAQLTAALEASHAEHVENHKRVGRMTITLEQTTAEVERLKKENERLRKELEQRIAGCRLE